MLIRVTRRSSGLDYYLETGRKKGRELSRDELDQRVHLAGDLNTFSRAVAFTNRNKDWKEHYFHITAGFAIENNELSDETLRAINRDFLEYYFCDYDIDDLILTAEAHRPKFQSEVDKTTGEINQRLLHFHIGVSMLDINTGNQVRMIPFNLEADKAFQSRMAKKYGLIDPADRKRDKLITKKDIIDRWKNNPTSKQTKVAELRHLFAELVDDVENIDEAIELLNGLDVVESVELKEQKSGNKYLQVKTTVGSKDINLRGKGFESLEKLYYSADELAEREAKGKYHSPEFNENKDIDHKKWWLEQQAKRGHGKKIDYAALEAKHERHFAERSKEERVFYVLYKNNIKEELVHGFRMWEKANTRYLFNNDLGVKIYDRPDQITAQIPDDQDKRSKTIALMLEMARAKGWDLNNLTVEGSADFKKEVVRQIEQQSLVSTEAAALEVAMPDPEQKKTIFNGVSQEVHYNNQRKAELLSKEQISAIKADLDADAVINYTVANLGLVRGHFSVIDNKIADDRTRAKPKNVIDFFTKTCNIPLTDALPILNGLLAAQEKAQQPEPEKTNDRTNSDIRYFKHVLPKRHPGPARPITDNRLRWLSERNLARDRSGTDGTTDILQANVLADRRGSGGVRRGDTGSAERQLNESALPHQEQIPMNISICTNRAINALDGWKNIEVKTFADLEKTIKSHSYGGFGQLKDGYRLGENVVSLSNLAIFDIDNDPGKEQLSIEQARELLTGTTYLIVTSRSHQKDKDGKPAVDRYRIIVPLTEPLSVEKDLYRLQMVKLADELGLTAFSDPKALKDIARYYYPSPAEAQVFVNNTHQALNSSGAKQFGIDELARLEAAKQAARADFNNRIKPAQRTQVGEFNNKGEYPFSIDFDAMNKLPLDEIYTMYRGENLEMEGSYLMGKGFTDGTSQSRKSLTIFQDSKSQDWLWYDFKTDEKGNVLTFMTAHHLNAYQAAQELQKKFGATLLSVNPAFYRQKVNAALFVATDDKTFRKEMYNTTGAEKVKLEKDGIQIADKLLSYPQLGFNNKGDVIEIFRKNRAIANRELELIGKEALQKLIEKEQGIEVDDGDRDDDGLGLG
jgi:hypothetical protein